jgi:hypothetical protein
VRVYTHVLLLVAFAVVGCLLGTIGLRGLEVILVCLVSLTVISLPLVAFNITGLRKEWWRVARMWGYGGLSGIVCILSSNTYTYYIHKKALVVISDLQSSKEKTGLYPDSLGQINTVHTDKLWYMPDSGKTQFRLAYSPDGWGRTIYNSATASWMYEYGREGSSAGRAGPAK